MKKLVIAALFLGGISACTPVRAVGNVAVGAGQAALGAVDVVL